jgi:DNA polymerase-3 subunit alpha
MSEEKVIDQLRSLVMPKAEGSASDVAKLEQEIQSLIHMDDAAENLLSLYGKVQRGDCKVKKGNKLNSLVAFYLGITTKRPVTGFALDKRRTYGRSGFPDIDMDFCYIRRHEIIEYLIEKYGRDYVGNIGVIQTLQTKAAIRRVLKVLDPENTIRFDQDGKLVKSSDVNENYQLENRIAKTLPKIMVSEDGEKIKSLKAAYKTFPEFKAYMDRYPAVFEAACKMEGKVQGFGIHAAGVVISPIPLSDICPLHVTTKGPESAAKDKESKEEKGETRGRKEKGTQKQPKAKKEVTLATQFTMGEVESLGLIKMDILALSTQTAIDWTVNDLRAQGIKLPPLDHLPKDDPKTLSLCRSGKTDGVFQLEMPGMQKTVKQIGIDNFDDLIVAVAMYRPGPLQYISLYADRKHGRAPVNYAHPLIKGITEKTYGIMVYQEQVMQAFMTLANLPPSEGYNFMKGCAKKKPAIIAASKVKFIRGALANGISQKVVDQIWADMEKFAGYAFNKAHAASYAYKAFQTAYLKAHHPLIFMCNRLSTENIRRRFDIVEKFERDCRDNLGYRFLAPDINRSKIKYLVVDQRTILRPLLIKGIGVKAAENIVSKQPFKAPDYLFDFTSRVGSSVNTRVIEAMCDAGMWKFLKKNRRYVIEGFEMIKKDLKRGKGEQRDDLFARPI